MFTNGVLQSKGEGETAISHKALQKAALHFPSELLKTIIYMQGRDASGYSELRNTVIQAWIYQRLCSHPHPTEESSRAHVSSHPTHLQPLQSHPVNTHNPCCTQVLQAPAEPEVCCCCPSEKMQAGENCAWLEAALRTCHLWAPVLTHPTKV